MIIIQDKTKCCGCSACVHICPKHSISFKEDSEGFLYPEVSKKSCIDCGLCEKVCPVINQNNERLPLKVFAAKHRDDKIRMSSSSGGVFTLLAEQIIDEGGVVFGAKFNESWEVVHDFAETKEDLIPFRGSKYVQSRIGDAYINVERFLKSGRKVMFTGTPCQIAGLKKYLRKQYENLLAVDFVCHGVPSPMVWGKYLEEELARQGEVGKKSVLTSSKAKSVLSDVSFRDKSTGWKKFSFVLSFFKSLDAEEKNTVLSTVFYENAYMDAFLSNLSLRPSCYACPAKSGKSEADVTIGDFWGIEQTLPEFDDDKGVSLILDYGTGIVETPKIDLIESSYIDAIKGNSCIWDSVGIPINRRCFFKNLVSKDFSQSLRETTSHKLYYRLKRMMLRKL